MGKISENGLTAKLLMAGMIASSVFFFRDVVIDLNEHIKSSIPYSTADMLHLIFELASVLFLLIGLALLRERVERLKHRDVMHTQMFHALREDFDALVHKKFDEWCLTAAEADVALLLLHGLSTSDIADLRKSAVGTVKVQAHHVLQKAGVSSRVELMSLFLDEFIDVGFGTVDGAQVQAS